MRHGLLGGLEVRLRRLPYVEVTVGLHSPALLVRRARRLGRRGSLASASFDTEVVLRAEPIRLACGSLVVSDWRWLGSLASAALDLVGRTARPRWSAYPFELSIKMTPFLLD